MAITLVSHVAKTTTGTTAAIDTTGASFLVATIGWTSSGTQIALSDSNSNVWVPFAWTGGGNSAQLSVLVAINPTVGAGHTFTLSGGASTLCVAAFSGVATTFPVGVGNKNGAGSGTSVSPGSITPGRDNCLVIAAMAYRDTTTISVSGGFTITDQNPFIIGSSVGSAFAYLVQTTAAAANPTFSWTNSAGNNAMILAVQPPPSGGGGGGGAWAFA